MKLERNIATTRDVVMVVAFLLVVGVFQPADALADAIRLSRSTVVRGIDNAVTLRDVANVIGADALRARDIELIAPSDLRIGAEFEITIDMIRESLLRHKVNLGRIALSGDRCRVVIAPKVETKEDDESTSSGEPQLNALENRSGVWAIDIMNEQTLRGQIARTLVGQVFKCDPSSIRITFSDDDRDDLRLSTAVHDFEIIPQATDASPQIPLDVRVFQGQRIVRSIRTVVQIALRQEVYVADRYIARGDLIRPGDFVREIRVIEPHPIAPEDVNSRLEGQEARGRIVRGEILRVGQVLDPIAVRRNDELDLICKIGAFIVSQKVRTLESGRIGDVIRVRLLTRRTELNARIEPDGSLSVVQ